MSDRLQKKSEITQDLVISFVILARLRVAMDFNGNRVALTGA